MARLSSPKTVAVIGAGPAGLAAAYQLSKKGGEVPVFEASGAVGGLARTIDLWGQKVDPGPHPFFSSDTRVNKAWLEIIAAAYAIWKPRTPIYYHRRLLFYPP